MEKWKIGVIAVMLLGLVGYGISQQSAKSGDAAVPGAPPAPGTTAMPVENKAADFIGQQLGGKKISEWTSLGPWENAKQPIPLSSLAGKPALIEVFRIKCSHCQEAAPFLEALYKRYQPRGLKMVAIQSPGDYKSALNEETQWPAVQAFVKAAGLTYPVAMDKNSQYFQQTLGGTYYPTTMLANAKGKIVYAQTGHDVQKAVTLAIEIEKLFPGAATPKQQAADLAKFLQPMMFGNGKPTPAMLKALTDDLEQRLLGKA